MITYGCIYADWIDVCCFSMEDKKWIAQRGGAYVLNKTDRRKIARVKLSATKSYFEEDVWIGFCTCIGALDPKLDHFGVDLLIIDEATQITEPTLIVPLMRLNMDARVYFLIHVAE